MKRKISVLAAVLLAIGLTACGNNEGQAANDTAETIQAASSEEVEAIDNTEEEALQVVTSEAASSTNDEIVRYFFGSDRELRGKRWYSCRIFLSNRNH